MTFNSSLLHNLYTEWKLMWLNWSPEHITWHDNKSYRMYCICYCTVRVCRLKLHTRCCQSPHFEPVNMFKAKEKVWESALHLCASQLTVFSHFPSDLLSLKSHRSAPLPRTIITLVCDPRWVAGTEMNSPVGLQGLEYYFVWANTACSTPHSFTSSDWCWQFPQTKLCHSETWSMALIYPKSSPPSDPEGIYFWQTTKNSWCLYSTHRAAAKTTSFTEIPSLLHLFF